MEQKIISVLSRLAVCLLVDVFPNFSQANYLRDPFGVRSTQFNDFEIVEAKVHVSIMVKLIFSDEIDVAIAHEIVEVWFHLFLTPTYQ